MWNPRIIMQKTDINGTCVLNASRLITLSVEVNLRVHIFRAVKCQKKQNAETRSEANATFVWYTWEITASYECVLAKVISQLKIMLAKLCLL